MGGAQLLDARLKLGLGLGQLGVDLVGPPRQRRSRGGTRRRHLVQTGPGHRAVPRGAHRGVALVAGAGRGALAAEGVAGVVAPQPPVRGHPGGVVVDDHRRPRQVGAGAHSRAVAAAVVDEGDADADLLLAARPRQQETHHLVPARHPAVDGRRRHADDVVAGQVGPAVRPGAGVDHRVGAVDELQVGVVDAAAQVVAHLVVRRERHPRQLRPGRRAAVGAGVGLDEEEGDLLPVGLVVVDPGERRAPVVHGVAEPVLQHEVARVARGAHVVRRPPRGAAGLVVDLGRGREAAGHLAADHQREPQERVDQPAQQPHGGETAAALEDRAVGAAAPLLVGLAVQRLVDEVQLEPVARVGVGVRREPVGVELPGRDDDLGLLRAGDPPVERRAADVVLRLHRQEELALGEAQHRLEAPGEREHLVGGEGGVGRVGHAREATAAAGAPQVSAAPPCPRSAGTGSPR